MSGPTNPGSPPPEVPEEFAAAYRAAYERALAAQTAGQHRDDPPAPQDERADEGADEDEAGEQALPRRKGPLRVGTHREPEVYDDDRPTWFENVRDSTWFVPLLLALLALLLILGAYAVGRGFAGQVEGSPQSDVVVDTPDGEIQPFSNQKPGKGAWTGKVTRVEDVRAKVGCIGKPGKEANGDPVSFEPSNLTDGVADTTWRCGGRAIGERITLKLSKTMPIGQVGLVPGYAKTDEQTNADRFAENNRVKRVRWTIGDTQVVQRFSGSPDDRNLQLVRVPKTRADTVVLEIRAVKRGPRNKTAISEIQIGRAG